jgi:hypothetical protein
MDRRVHQPPAPFFLEALVNHHSLLTPPKAHMAERIREDLRETSESVQRFMLGTAVATLFALANRYGTRSSRAERGRLRANRRAKRAALQAIAQQRNETLN